MLHRPGANFGHAHLLCDHDRLEAPALSGPHLLPLPVTLSLTFHHGAGGLAAVRTLLPAWFGEA